jgi:hypothetical protein
MRPKTTHAKPTVIKMVAQMATQMVLPKDLEAGHGKHFPPMERLILAVTLSLGGPLE